jgi:hypothetical protein
VLLRLSPKENLGAEQIERLARHISAFSIAALTHIGESDSASRA